MGTIRVVDAGDGHFRSVSDVPGRRDLEGSQSEAKVHHTGEEGGLQYFQVRLPPNGVIPQHAHDEDEIVVVQEGSLRLGRRVLGPGSSVYIPARTLYATSARRSWLSRLLARTTPASEREDAS